MNTQEDKICRGLSNIAGDTLSGKLELPKTKADAIMFGITCYLAGVGDFTDITTEELDNWFDAMTKFVASYPYDKGK